MKFEVYIIANRFEVLKRISVNSSLNLGLIFRRERIFLKKRFSDVFVCFTRENYMIFIFNLISVTKFTEPLFAWNYWTFISQNLNC